MGSDLEGSVYGGCTAMSELLFDAITPAPDLRRCD
jgi:hypothetical protein